MVQKFYLDQQRKYDNIRGLTIEYGVLDECAFMKEDAWREAIRPVFMVKGKKVLFISTPKGKNWFHELFQLAMSYDHSNYVAVHWFIIRYTLHLT